MSSVLSSIATALWVLIELIPFGYMAYLMWRDRNNAHNRNIQRARSTFASA